MSSHDRPDAPWWASTGADGLDPGQDPLDAHRRGRAGDHDTPGDGAGGRQQARDHGGGDVVDALIALLAAAGRRVADRGAAAAAGDVAAAAHEDGQVCDACPVCRLLRAVRQSRPDVVTHLADAAHHVSLALQALAEASDAPDGGLEHIDLDP